jgi:hypothetical protein
MNMQITSHRKLKCEINVRQEREIHGQNGNLVNEQV